MLPRNVADTITAIRDEGRCDMLDRFCVEALAYGRGCMDTVRWIESHDAEYGQAVLHGYEAEEE